ncbi:GntR family transcriptional regulator [Microbacterium capsulatum]|uniref:GntR family transcriptional regulator n=1 Tax=Microbacterium capsulatum TaxID=3041921 RepID=A0ABU0XIW6_9MICO|nr:GntR family transcriptional regulator [Microbacterium sp. ASV81]MDQ4215083.1 GntR family transcriptional regulator [Microbacterium sp. ASV81]
MAKNASERLYQHQVPMRDIVADEIRARIFDGRLPAGERLVERDLAESFGVSRHPVREALRVLQREGIVESLASRGLIVTSLSKRQVLDLYMIREALESVATREAALRVAEGAEHHLDATIAEAQAAVRDGDIEAAHAANARFHDELIALSGNEALEHMLEPILGRLHWLFRQVADVNSVVVEHARIAEAVTAGDAEWAATLARAHVLAYRNATMKLLFDEGTDAEPGSAGETVDQGDPVS